MNAPKILLLLTFLSCGMADKAFATSYTWGGTATGTWNTAGSWASTSAFPGSTGTIDIANFNTATAVSISSLGQPTISIGGIVTGASSGAVTISDSTTTDTLVLTGANAITISSSDPTTVTLDLNTSIASFITSNAMNAGTGTVNFGTGGSSMNLALTGTKTTTLENGTFNIGSKVTLVGTTSSAALSVNGVNGATTLNYDATGTSGTLTNTGALTATNGGTLNLQASTSLREGINGTTGSALYITTSGVKTTGIVQFGGGVSGTFTIGTNIASSTSVTGTFVGGINLNNAGTGSLTDVLYAASKNTAYFTGALSNNTITSGSYNVLISGSGTVVLAGANTYTGPTSVSAGSTLELQNNLALQNSALNTDGGGVISLVGTSGTFSTPTIGGLTGNTNVNSSLFTQGYGSVTGITLNTQAGATTTYNGSIADGATGMTLTVTGSGTQVFSGSSSYTGSTTISSGSTFITNTSGSALGSGPLTVAAGSTFGGSGSATGLSSYTIGAVSSPVTTLQVGSGADVTSNLTLTATGASSIKNTNLEFNLNTTGASNELVVGTTALTLTGDTLTLNVTSLGVISANTPYILIAGTGGNGNGLLTGSQYSGLTDGGTAANGFELINGLTLNFTGIGAPAGWYNNSYVFLVNNGGVDDIEVEVVPEPSTWAMMIGGLALLVFIQRRRGARNADERQARGKV